MKTFFAIVALFIFTALANAQCSNGSCNVGRGRVVNRVVTRTRIVQRQQRQPVQRFLGRVRIFKGRGCR